MFYITLRFAKMHGLGNDYVFVNGFSESLPEDRLPALARAVSDRHFGIGSDGLILILPSRSAEFRMRIFNSDGSEAEMCGNGVRCFAKYVYEKGLTRSTSFAVETLAGIIRPELITKDGKVSAVRVDMGEPRLSSSEIPMTGEPLDCVIEVPLEAAGRSFAVTCVSMGNPHCVVFEGGVDSLDLETYGAALEKHPRFPERTNVEFAEVVDPARIKVRVWERGSGITMACGTGACAVAVAGWLTGRAGRAVTVELPGGELEVEWAEDGHVYMTGPAEEVYEGTYLQVDKIL